MKTDLLRLPVVFHPYLIAVEIVCAVGFGLLAHILVQRTILRMNFQDALKVKE